MNERIQELVEQAGGSIGTGLEFAVVFGETEDVEKFAELIVKECIGCIQRVGILEDIENETDMVVDAVKEHFGVE